MTSSTGSVPAGDGRDAALVLHASIFEYSADAIITMTLEGIITSWNPAAEQLYDYTSEEILGKHVTVLCSSDRRDEMTATLEKIRQGYRVGHYETLRVRKDGQVIPVSLAVTALRDASGSITGASSSARDITERKEAEGEQRQATQYARSLFEASLDPLVTLSVEGKITDVNEATIKVTGVARAGLIGSDFFDYFTEPDKARESYQRVFAEGSVTDYPLTICHKNGALTDVLYNASVYRDAGDNVIGVVAVARDVTEQKQATQYARSLFEASLDPLVTISVEGKITDVNEATIKVTGVARAGLIGSDFFDYFTEPDKAREGYQRVFAEGSVTDYPLTICHQNGALTDVLYNASVYRDAGDNVIGVVAVARDVTEQKQAQADIAEQQAKEMERLAELERFQRLTVGRELKMIELKKEIVELNTLIAPLGVTSS
jgi:PAS domain S-box-containing protein